MSLVSHQDSCKTKAVALSDVVAMCTNCTDMCWDKTQRVVSNTSRAPRGWESLYGAIATDRRQEEYEMCTSRCQLVRSSCPEVDKLKKYESIDEKALKRVPYPDGIPSLQELSRCEHAVEDFSRVLFALAHKPSKVVFETSEVGVEKEGRLGGGKGSPPTEVHEKVLKGANVDDEILRRWSTARKERLQMEELGVLRTGEEAAELKRRLLTVQKDAVADGSGTVPKW